MKTLILWTNALLLLASLSTFADSAVGTVPTYGSRAITLGQPLYLTLPTLTCGEDAQKKQLWLDGMDTGVRSLGCDDVAHLLLFNVERTGAAATVQTDKAWQTLLRDPLARTDKRFERPVEVAILNGDGSRAAALVLPMRLLDAQRLLVGVLAVLGACVLLGYGIFRSGMLRDSGVPVGGGERPFSLARTQMVWWFAIVFFSYVVLWLVTMDLPTIPSVVLGLIGLSGATALAAAALDQGKPVPSSRGFWTDISTDAQGVTLPRVQQIAWTFLFGMVFINRVLNGLAMPDFDSSTLALMGISAGAYLGFKVPETQVLPGAAAPAAPPVADDDGKSAYSPTSDATLK
jgi:hypothetical protein